MTTTLTSTLVGGDEISAGTVASYRRVRAGAGEPRVLRSELMGPAGPAGPAGRRRRSIAHLAHVTDLQLTDVQSPGRFEFLECLRGMPGSGAFVPAQRPQEAMVAHAMASMMRALDGLRSPDTGAPLDVVVSTGDNLDNAQWNELCWYLALLGGGQVALGGAAGLGGATGGSPPSKGARSVQALRWPNDLYWHPDGGADRWRALYGFPTIPGLLERALAPFTASGLRVPWLSCYGNHDGLPFGEVVPSAEYRAIVLGTRKAHSLPAGLDPFAAEQDLHERPEFFLSGPSHAVPADASRRVVGRKEFVAAHLRAPGEPAGHGYSAQNLEAGITYFVHDLGPQARLIVLDTANLDGWSAGSIGARQLAWLEARLVECHASYTRPDGGRATGGADRLVVLASHHGLSTLSNLRQSPGGAEDDHPRAGAAAIEALLARFPNVVLWLNGHRHLNQIVARPTAGHDGRPGGYFEVSTASLADWPSQGRLVEIVANGDGTLSVLTTMVDHVAPPDPADSRSEGRDASSSLASIHRELAANVPGAGFGSRLEGRRHDRNCELLLPAPFALGEV